MSGDGEPSDNPLEPEGADQASTSGSSGEALAKQAHDNPAFVGNATASTSGDQQPSPESRGGEARANVASGGPTSGGSTSGGPTSGGPASGDPTSGGPTFIPFQNDGGWVPLVLCPVMFPGDPEPRSATPGPESADGATIPQWMPVLFPVQMPLFVPLPPSDQAGQNGGFYPVPPLVPVYGPLPGPPPGFKFPVPMNVPMPTEGNPPAGATAGQQAANTGEAPPAAGGAPPVVGEGVPPVGQMQPNGVPPVAQVGAGQVLDNRRIVRRFQVGIQLDLLLLLKLAVVVFVFNQDGSKDRLLLLMGLAGVIYLYQTGSLAPLLRWLAEKAQHFMTPPEQLPQARPDGRPAPDVQAREAPAENAANPANPAVEEPADGAAADAPAEGAANAPLPGGPVERRQPQGPFWGFVKEVQMLVVGFVTSLLPGFHPHAD